MVAMPFAMKHDPICFSPPKLIAVAVVIAKIAGDCGCDAAVHCDSALNKNYMQGDLSCKEGVP